MNNDERRPNHQLVERLLSAFTCRICDGCGRLFPDEA